MTAPCCNRRASNRTRFGESMGISKVSSRRRSLVVGDEGNERVEQRRVAARGAAADEDIAAGVQHPLGFVTDVRGQGALCDQLRRRKGSVCRRAAR